MPDVDRLVAAMRDCLVQVVGDSVGSVGSGFFVAPGRVLTCAHVAGSVGARISVQWNGGTFAATVRSASRPKVSGERVWPDPDLAIVQLDEPPNGHSCVWLDSRTPGRQTEFVIAGFSDQLNRHGDQVTADVTLSGRHGHGDGRLMKINQEEVAPGMSGGPVLNTVTGGVCGVVKATRGKGPVGGFVVPVRAARRLDRDAYRDLVRAHDRHHGTDRRWVELASTATREPDNDVSRAEERELRALLADLPIADNHAVAYERAAGPTARPLDAADEPVDYADVVTDLAELVPAHGIPHLLVYAVDLAESTSGSGTEEIRYWIAETAGRLRIGPEVRALRADRSRTVPRVSVMARLRPWGNNRDRYSLTVWRYITPGNVVPAHPEDEPVPIEAAWEKLRQVLQAEIRHLSEYRTGIIIELFVPRTLMNEKIEDWRIGGGGGTFRRKLGRRHPVVYRALERLQKRADYQPEWDARSRSLRQRNIGPALQPVRCNDRREHDAMDSWMNREAATAPFVLPGPVDRGPSRVAIEVGIASGVPLMLWPRCGCDGCNTGSCPADSFLRRLRSFLAETRLADVPDRMKEFRTEPEPDGATGSSVDHGVGVLWDDPERLVPYDLLTEPEAKGES